MKKRPFLEELEKLSKNNKIFALRKSQALDWYRNKIKALLGSKSLEPNSIFDKKNYKNSPEIGNIVTFKYSPKTKIILPYYDMFPLVLIIKMVPGGFIGLNFHYLHPTKRAFFMEKLYEYQTINAQTTKNKAPKTIINIKYNTLVQKASLISYKACIKRYNTSHIKGFFYTLLPNEWDIALFLPTEKFVGAKKEKVWEDSKQIVKRSI